MALGVRELLLIIRARDQTARLVSDVSRNFGNLGRDLEASANSATLAWENHGRAIQELDVLMAKHGGSALGYWNAEDTAAKNALQSQVSYNKTLAETSEARMAQLSQSQAMAQQSMETGKTLLGVGAAFTLVGAAGLAFYGSTVKAAIDYNRESSLTLTQTQGLGISLKDIERIGIQVAQSIPAPFEQMQKSLYDIFSSINVNAAQAQDLLTAFAKGAVAGQTDVQTAGRATISIMNAFKIPVSDVNHVMDVQFQIVKDGVITYDEFASSIGRAIPSAIKAGQSVETLGGLFAFLTRNGLSASQAATSAARGMDLFSNPKFGDALKEIGINVADVNGAFRPIPDVIDDIKTKFGDLAPAQRTLEFLKLGGEGSADALAQMGINLKDASGNMRPLADVAGELESKFKGLNEQQVADMLSQLTSGAGGTVQAMRFLNLAVGDSHGLLDQLTNDVRTSGGAAATAYKTMKDTPAAQIEDLKNQWKTMKVQLGEELLPIFLDVVKAVKDVITWFTGLDENTKHYIAIGGLLAAALFLLIGLVLVMAGAVMILNGACDILFGTTLLAALPIIGVFLVAVLAVIAATVAFHEFFNVSWPQAFGMALLLLLGPFGMLIDAIILIAQKTTIFEDVWHAIEDVLGNVKGAFVDLWHTLEGFGGAIGDLIGAIPGFFESLPGIIMGAFRDAINWLAQAGQDVISGFITGIVTAAQELPHLIGVTIHDTLVGAAFTIGWLLRAGYDLMLGLYHGIEDGLGNTLDFFTKLPGRVVDFFNDAVHWLTNDGVDILLGLWHGLEDGAGNVWDFIQSIPGRIAQYFDNALHWLDTQGTDIAHGLWHGIEDGAGAVWDFLQGVPGDVEQFFNDAIHWLDQAGHDVIDGLWNGIQNAWNSFIDGIGNLPDDIINAFKDGLGISSPSTVMYDIGIDLIQGLINGVESLGSQAVDAVGNIAQNIWDNVTSFFDTGSPSKKMSDLGQDVSTGLANGINNNAPLPIEAANNLVTGTLKPVTSAVGDFATQVANTKGPLTDLAGGINNVHTAITPLSDDYANLAKGQLDSDRTAISFARSLSGLETSLGKNGATLDLNTEAGQRNLTALDNMVDSSIKQVAQMKDQKVATETINTVLGQHVEQLRAVMTQAGFTKDQIDAYIVKMGLVVPVVSTRLNVDNALAWNILDQTEIKLKVLSAPELIALSVQVYGADNAKTILDQVKHDTGNINDGLNVLPPAAVNAVNNAGSQGVSTARSIFGDIGSEAGRQQVNALNAQAGNFSNAAVGAVAQGQRDAFGWASQWYPHVGGQAALATSGGMDDHAGDVSNSAVGVVAGAQRNAFGWASNWFPHVGVNADIGIANGMNSPEGIAAIQAAGRAAGSAALNAANAILRNSSPSKAMAEIGKNASLGLAIGISNKTDEIAKAAQSMVEAFSDPLHNGMDVTSGAIRDKVDALVAYVKQGVVDLERMANSPIGNIPSTGGFQSLTPGRPVFESLVGKTSAPVQQNNTLTVEIHGVENAQDVEDKLTKVLQEFIDEIKGSQ